MLFFKASKALQRQLLRFRRETSGNIAVIFTLALLPILGFVGLAVDYSRAASYRSKMQAAIDAAALMVSKDAAANSSMTAAQITTKAQGYFNAMFVTPELTGISVTATYATTGTKSLSMTAQGSMPTYFASMFGFPTFPVNSSSQTTWATQGLRVALALDNTGSMTDNGKITALRSAATSLVTTLSNLSKNSGDVYISLVPFAEDVNLGISNVAATWIDWTDWDLDNSTKVCDSYFIIICLHYANVPKSHALWSGCITDRTQDYDTKNTTPSGIAGTLFPADEKSYCKIGNIPYLQPVVGLTENWTLLKASIALMAPTGDTNQPIGLAWAWQSLTQGVPLSPPVESSTITYQKAIVLMSDGLNTSDRWSGYGATQIDARQRILCDNIKAAGIVVHAIQVNTGSDPTSAVLQYCASPGNFQLVTSASQLVTAFDKVAVALTKLRIAL